MNIPILLQNMLDDKTTIEKHQRTVDTARTSLRNRMNKLGKILASGLDADNFPLRLQLADGYELRVSDAILEIEAPCEPADAMAIRKTDNIDQATLMKLLEDIEE